MRYVLRGVLVILALATGLPAVIEAGNFGRPNPCCVQCQQPRPQCQCAVVQPVPQVSYQPVVETQYATQPQITYRDVPQTEYRSEAVHESVPVVTYDSVTTDEGSYQSVWVPKPVTRQVARTVYQPRISYRSVPYQTTRRVAEYSTQAVPYQTVRYVPTTTTTAAQIGYVPSVASSGVPIYSNTAMANPYPWQPNAAAPIVYAPSATPVVSSAPAYAPAPVTASAGSLTPVPDARFSTAATTPIQPRTASRDSMYDGYEPAPYNPSSTPSSATTTAGGPSLFVPAPSAAHVWRTPRGSVTR